ncbi:MAG: GNAT family N-acetyltransferase [Bacteroidales bacterium]|nr:GNAT family N-acetyltransferase [Bacteroidales bacterium]
MKYFKQLTGTKCYLSPPALEDAALYCQWLNDLNVSRYLEPSFSLTVEEETEILKNLHKENKVFGIHDINTDKLIGSCGLHEINPVNQTAMFGIFIGDAGYWNKGVGTEAAELCIDFAFNVMNLHNLYLYVYEYNKRAIASYKKTGFTVSGKRREGRYYAGKRHDIIIMDILRSEFTSPFIIPLGVK